MASLDIPAGQDVRRLKLPLTHGDIAVMGFAAGYAVVAIALLLATDARQAFAFRHYLVVWPFVFLMLFPFIYGLLVLLKIVHRIPDRRGRLMALRRAVRPHHMQPFATGLLLLCCLMVFQGAFTSLKTALPLWSGGFPNDVAQAEIDRALHFGVDPWRYLTLLGSNRWVHAAIEWNYNQGWFIFCYATLFFVAISARATAVRTRYLFTYMLTWIVVGNVLAGLFLSAGPVFYEAVTGDSQPFGEQIAFLSSHGDGPHSVPFLQSYLWQLYKTGNAGFGSGISAFPSMHVALATLNALFIGEVFPKWRLPAFAYVVLVLVSSVYLAWHYAIDGYVAIVVTIAIYAAMKLGFGRLAIAERRFRA